MYTERAIPRIRVLRTQQDEKQPGVYDWKLQQLWERQEDGSQIWRDIAVVDVSPEEWKLLEHPDCER
jgi:hypothetical protein